MFLFLWFLSALRQAVRRLEADDGFLTGLTTIGGVVYATLTLAALAVDDRDQDDERRHLPPQVFPGLIHAADDVELGAARLRRGRARGRDDHCGLARRVAGTSGAGWAGWLGILVGILWLGLIAFFPWFLVAIWILVVSIGMFMRARPRAGVTAA